MTLVKWIVCQVREEQRAAFDVAQRQWGRLANAPGFRGQIGGWDHADPTQACILALWEDERAYRHFMDKLHDEIADQNAQAHTYNAIQVSMAESLLPMPGRYPTLAAALANGTILRVADCAVRDDRVDHFTTVQAQVWLPAMAASAGMLGGAFSRQQTEHLRYLVTTLWDTPANHEHYAATSVPLLREQADVTSDLASLCAYCVMLVAQWTILPDARHRE